MKRISLLVGLILGVALIAGIAAAPLLDTVKAYRKIIDVADATTTYVGEAATTTQESAAGWRIYRAKVSGNLTYIQYAAYSVECDKVWNDRATYNYGTNP